MPPGGVILEGVDFLDILEMHVSSNLASPVQEFKEDEESDPLTGTDFLLPGVDSPRRGAGDTDLETFFVGIFWHESEEVGGSLEARTMLLLSDLFEG